MAALTETSWDIYQAIKLIKLKQLLATNLADKEQCKEALMTCQWNVHEAATVLLTQSNEQL